MKRSLCLQQQIAVLCSISASLINRMEMNLRHLWLGRHGALGQSVLVDLGYFPCCLFGLAVIPVGSTLWARVLLPRLVCEGPLF